MRYLTFPIVVFIGNQKSSRKPHTFILLCRPKGLKIDDRKMVILIDASHIVSLFWVEIDQIPYGC